MLIACLVAPGSTGTERGKRRSNEIREAREAHQGFAGLTKQRQTLRALECVAVVKPARLHFARTARALRDARVAWFLLALLAYKKSEATREARGAQQRARRPVRISSRAHMRPENPPDKWLTLPIMVLENSKLVKMTVPLIAPWLPMRLSGNTLLLKLFPKN